jgi:hypothetical protein
VECIEHFLFNFDHQLHDVKTKSAMAAITTTSASKDLEEDEDHYVDAEKKTYLMEEGLERPKPPEPTRLSTKFWISTGVNTASTAAIVRREQKERVPELIERHRSSSTKASSRPNPSATHKSHSPPSTSL